MSAYRDALSLLERRSENRWELGLSRMRGLLAALGDPHLAVPALHVAGTNGKGSFCALLEAVLRAAGLRTGLYTSPHLAGPEERIRLGGRALEAEEFGRRVLAAASADEREECTYFELVTAAAFLAFKEEDVQAALFEVGLGGRLDATNVLERPELTAITSIGLDHTEHLGSTLAEIAWEKAGILKPGVPCVVGPLPAQALAAVRERAAQTRAVLIEDAPRLRTLSVSWEEGLQEVAGIGGEPLRLRLLGRAAAANAGLVLRALEELRRRGYDIPRQALERGFAGVSWPCRFQPLRLDDRWLVLDGAHNPPALEAFLDTWSSSPWSREPSCMIVGMLKDKDWRTMLDRLAGAGEEFIVARPDSSRALEPEEAARALRRAGRRATVVGSPEEALAAWQKSRARTGAVCGSFYLAGRIWKLLQGAAAWPGALA